MIRAYGQIIHHILAYLHEQHLFFFLNHLWQDEKTFTGYFSSRAHFGVSLEFRKIDSCSFFMQAAVDIRIEIFQLFQFPILQSI